MQYNPYVSGFISLREQVQLQLLLRTNCCDLKVVPLKYHPALSGCFHGHKMDLFGVSYLSFLPCPCSASFMVHGSFEPIFVHSHLPLPCYYLYVVCSQRSRLHCYLCSFPPVMSALLLLVTKAQIACFLLLQVWHNPRLRMALALPWGGSPLQPSSSARLYPQLLLMELMPGRCL